MNPYKTLRTIHAVAARMPTNRDADVIMNEALLVLRAQHQPGPYATQRDALEAIRTKMNDRPFLNPEELREIAEQGLSLPPVEAIPVGPPPALTPAQQHADELAGHLIHYAGALDGVISGVPVDITYAQFQLAELSALLTLLRPPAPPTLDEALDVLRDLLGSDGNKKNVQAAHQLLARVPK